MIDLRRRRGSVEIGALPVALTHVRTLEAFDGPLLAEFQSEIGDTFLYHWCDRDRHEDINRWLVVRTPTQDLARYLVGIATLRDLIINCRDQFVYLVDLDTADRPQGVFFTTVHSLPSDYIPTERSHYDSADATAQNQQDVFIDKQWDDYEIAEYPRRFLQAYDFNALFGLHGEAQTVRTIDYRLTQGWVYGTLFAQLRARVPRDKQASLTEVAFASPGYVRFRVDPAIASDLRHAVARYLVERNTIETDSSLLAQWANERGDMTEESATRVFVNLCGQLGIRSRELLGRSDSVQIAVKALRSYVRKIEFLAVKDQERTAMLVGLRRPQDGTE